MPRISGVRERRHQPVWDSLVRTTGDPTPPVQAINNLFGNSNVGNLGLTNLQVAGQLAADQTYVILALRSYLFFKGTNQFSNYTDVSSQLYYTLTLGDKPVFSAPCWYFPAGGGLWAGSGGGNVGINSTTVLSNGEPGQDHILKLARPIVIPVRQNIQVSAQFFPVGTTNALTLLNSGQPDDVKVVQYYIDGLQTRDVQ